MPCLDENEIAELSQGLLSPEAAAASLRHLDGCSSCRQLFSALADGTNMSGADAGELPRRPAAATVALTQAPGFAAPPDRSSRRAINFDPGQLLGSRYRIVRYIARGGVGEVYEADDHELRQRVAVKTVRVSVASDELIVDRFRREIYLARKVTHPNVCRIFDLGLDVTEVDNAKRSIAFLTMELLEGETLAQRLVDQHRFTPDEALPLVRQMAAGLTAVHGSGVIHRDFKSANVMLVPQRNGDERVVITDFSLAGEVDGTRTGPGASEVTAAIMGTPAYMAPEQVTGERVTEAADIYALGVVLFEMVTGQLPFVDETPLLTALKRTHMRAPSPRELVPDLDETWEAVIMRCLEREPRARFATVADVVAALELGYGAATGLFPRAREDASFEATTDATAVTVRPVRRASTAGPRAPTPIPAVESTSSLSTDTPTTWQHRPSASAGFAGAAIETSTITLPDARPDLSDDPSTAAAAPRRRRKEVVVIAAAAAVLVVTIAIIVVSVGARRQHAAIATADAAQQVAQQQERDDAAVPELAADAGPGSATSTPTLAEMIAKADWTGALQACADRAARLSNDERTACGIAACNTRKSSLALAHYRAATKAGRLSIDQACRNRGISLVRRAPKDRCADLHYAEENPLKCQK